MQLRRAIGIGIGLTLAVSAVQARPQVRSGSDAQVRQQIIREAIASFHGACPCPYSKTRDRKGREHRCGTRSEYNRQGADIQCYPRDVSDSAVDAWRSDHSEGR